MSKWFVRRSTTTRFFALLIGSSLGVWLSARALGDYEIIKFTPPGPEDYNEDGSLKPKHLKMTFEPVQPLQLKPEAQIRMDKLRKEQEALLAKEKN